MLFFSLTLYFPCYVFINNSHSLSHAWSLFSIVPYLHSLRHSCNFPVFLHFIAPSFYSHRTGLISLFFSFSFPRCPLHTLATFIPSSSFFLRYSFSLSCSFHELYLSPSPPFSSHMCFSYSCFFLPSISPLSDLLPFSLCPCCIFFHVSPPLKNR